MSDKVGAELCSKTGGGNLETATKNKRKMAPESRLSQREKVDVHQLLSSAVGGK